MTSLDYLSSTIALLYAITAVISNNTSINNSYNAKEITNISSSTFKKNVPFPFDDKRK